jgi:hypothetical protein
VGKREVPSWLILTVELAGKVKESSVVAVLIEQPDPERSPTPAEAEALTTPGRLAGLPSTPAEQLSASASLKRLRIKVPSREVEVPVRALVHVTAEGRCDRFVPLELAEGLQPWFSAFLSTWGLNPGLAGGTPVDGWVVYTARARLKMSSLESSAVSVLRGEAYEPL